MVLFFYGLPWCPNLLEGCLHCSLLSLSSVRAGRAKSNFYSCVPVHVSPHELAGGARGVKCANMAKGRTNLKLNSVPPAGRNRWLSFLPPWHAGFPAVWLLLWLVRAREIFQKSLFLGGSSFQVRSQHFVQLSDSHLCHAKGVASSFASCVLLGCGLKETSDQKAPIL